MSIANDRGQGDGEARRFVGIGIDQYAHFGPLQAITEVRVIGRLLAERWGYDCVTIEGLCEDEADERLKTALPRAGLTGGALVVL